MRAVIQRVKKCEVKVNEELKGKIGFGLLVYLGVGEKDTNSDLDYIYNKIIGLRVFEDNDDKLNLSLKDIDADLMVISQFTLYGDVRKGKRPSFTKAAKPELGMELYNRFIKMAKNDGINVSSGVFGEHMEVNYINDGPVTILLDSEKIF